ncbi:MAG TPA: hypothetical protein VHI52_01095 [Verrucomicrobiae bacterium]|nr:hypothetical protein [Verrucomicrobiae bacterium]
MRHVKVYEALVAKGGRAASDYFNAHSEQIRAELLARHAANILASEDDDGDDDNEDPDACPECSGTGKCKCCEGTGKSTEEKKDE